MRTERIQVITLTERDVRLAAANAGLQVELAPETTKVIIRVVLEEEQEQP